MIKNQELPACKVGSCLKREKIKHASTSNLYSRLKTHHPCEYQAVRPKRKGPKGKGKASFSKAREGTFQESLGLLPSIILIRVNKKRLQRPIARLNLGLLGKMPLAQLPGLVQEAISSACQSDRLLSWKTQDSARATLIQLV